jgi:hypothetical protein
MKSIILALFLTTALVVNSVCQVHFDYVQHNTCDSSTVDFINLNPSGGYQPQLYLTTGFTYSWDFGNGQTSGLENPTGIFYDSPGVYVVDYGVIVDTVGFFLTEVEVTAVGCSDPFGGAPDPYIIIRDGSNMIVYDTQSSYYNNTWPTYTWSLNLKLDNPPYFIWVWDYDSMDSDDNCVDDTESTPGVSTLIPLPANNSTGFGITTFSGSNVDLDYTFSYNKPIEQYIEQQNITVLESPSIPQLSSTGGQYSIFDVIPPVTANVSTGNTVQWFDDSALTSLIHTGLSYQFVPPDTGEFFVWACQFDPVTQCQSEPLQLTFTIYDNTDIEELFGENDFNMYPNPADDFILIQSSVFRGEMSLEIYNCAGQIVKSTSFDFNGYKLLDVSILDKGIYYIAIQISDVKLLMKKLVIV